LYTLLQYNVHVPCVLCGVMSLLHVTRSYNDSGQVVHTHVALSSSTIKS